VLAYIRQHGDEVILCVANLSRSAQATELDLSAWKDRIPLEMLGRTRFPPIGELPYMITLAPYGFYWFQLRERDKSEHVEPTVVPEFETLVVPLGATWMSLARTRGRFRTRRVAGILARTRWYPERSAQEIRPTVTSAVPFCDIGDNRPWLAFLKRRRSAARPRATYCRCRSIGYGSIANAITPGHLQRFVRGAREGTLLDVATDQIFIALLLRNLREALTVEEAGLRLEFRPTSSFRIRRSTRPSISAPSRPNNPTARRLWTMTMWSRSIENSNPASIPRSKSVAF